MKKINISFKLLYKNKLLLTSVVTYSLFIVAALTFLSATNLHTPLSYLMQSQDIASLNFIFFICFSYIYYSKTRSSHLNELFKTIEKSEISTYLSQSLIVLGVNTFITLVFTIFNLIACFSRNLYDFNYTFHILNNMFINIWLIAFIGSLIGCFLSFVKNKLKVLSTIALIALVTSKIMTRFAYTFFYTRGINIYPLREIFDIFSPNLRNRPNTNWGLSVLPYRYEKILIWGLLLLAIIFFYFAYGKRKIILRICSMGCALLMIVNLVLYIQPQSKYIVSFDPSGVIISDHLYYEKAVQEEEEANFSATDYAIQMKIFNQINADVRISINNSDLEMYKFTLYHGFKVKSVTDTFLRPQKFVQNGDYLTVYNTNKEDNWANPLDELRITYEGFSPKYYSNIQGVFLPGYFPYYPQPGFKKIYNFASQEFIPVELNEAVNFRVGCTTPTSLYGNLKKSKSGNSFVGSATSITLSSGFLKEANIKGYDVVYPYIEEREPFTFTKRIIDKFESNINYFINKGYIEINALDKLKQKKFFIAPNVNQIDIERGVVLSDNVIIASFSFLFQGFMRSELECLKDKQPLKDIVMQYLVFKDSYVLDVKNTDEDNSNYDENDKMFCAKLSELGEDKVLKQCFDFLRDDLKTTDYTAFLENLK